MSIRLRLAAVPIVLFAVAATLAPLPGYAASRPAQASPALPATPVRFGNVGRTHSPELLRLLARHHGAVPAAAETGIAQGVDVASQQHAGGASIDWPQVAADGYKFAFIKATEGSYYVNPYFASDYRAAKAAGLVAAAYHFANPSYSGGTLQADFAANAAQYAADGKTLPIVADMEYDPYATADHTNECYGLTHAAMVAWLTAFSAELVRRTGNPPIIYTTAGWWNKCTGSSKAFGTDQLWIASWDVASPTLPAGWRKWQFWQYTSSALVNGITTNRSDVSYLGDSMLEMLAPGVQSGAATTAASLQVAVLGSDPSQGITYNATGLPVGVTLDPAAGLASGTWPATPQSGTAEVTATSTAGATGTTSFRWFVHEPVTLTKPGPQTSVSLGPAELQVQASDGLLGCTLTFTATGLPPGLSMTSCGKVQGWITRAGSYTATVAVTDASAAVLATVTFPWTVRAAPAGGRARPVPLAATAKCLRGAPGGTAVTAQPCDHRADQAWTLTVTSTMRTSGKCLDDPGPAGTAAVLAACDGSAAQRWQDNPGTGLINPGSGLCLDEPAGAGAKTLVQVTTCSNSHGQQWILPNVTLAAGVPGYCAAATPAIGGGRLGAALQHCRSATAQEWTVMPDGTLMADGKCLSTLGATTVGSQLHLAACDGAATQQWQLVGPSLGAQFANPVASLCVGKPPTAPARTQLALEPCANLPGTTWHIS